MTSYEFVVESHTGPLEAIVGTDGSLEIFDLNVEHEQAMNEFSDKASPAYALVLLWDRLTDVVAFRYGLRQDLMDALAVFISECPNIVERWPMTDFVFNDDEMEFHSVHNALASLLKEAVANLDETACLAIARFARAIGVHVEINPGRWETKQIDEFATLFMESHYLVLANQDVAGPWNKYSKCVYTDIFYFTRKSVAATSADDPDYDPRQEISPEEKRLAEKIMNVIGIKDPPADDACLYADSPPWTRDIGIAGKYALAYYLLRPHEETPYSVKRYEPTLIEYPDLVEARKAASMARAIDEANGHSYDIRIMVRTYDRTTEEYEHWDHMSKKRRQRVGSFHDWVAQNWEEV
jgi:hypothetical protein